LDISHFDDFSNPESLAHYKDAFARRDQNADADLSVDMPPRSAFVGFTFRHSDWQDKIIE
jgi:hypothetical protein